MPIKTMRVTTIWKQWEFLCKPSLHCIFSRIQWCLRFSPSILEIIFNYSHNQWHQTDCLTVYQLFVTSDWAWGQQNVCTSPWDPFVTKKNGQTQGFIYISSQWFYKLRHNIPLINPLRPADLTRSSLVQVMAWRFFSTKPLPESMLTYCQLDPCEQIPLKFETKYKIISLNSIWKCCLQNNSHSVTDSVW